MSSSHEPQDPKILILTAIDKFIELRRSEWGQIPSQTGDFNPHVARYTMLQHFRTAIEHDELRIPPMPDLPFDRLLFQTWQPLAHQAVGNQPHWGHPIRLSALYGHLPWMPWLDFITHLQTLQNTLPPEIFELIPSRRRNWKIGDRSIGALTFHSDPQTTSKSNDENDS